MNKIDRLLRKMIPTGGVFKTPHKHQDRIFATDGHLMLDVPESLCDSSYSEQVRIKNPLVVTSVPLLEVPKQYNVEEIYSRLTDKDLEYLSEKAECKMCEGYGGHECVCGHSHDCDHCGGTGRRDVNANFALFDGKPFQFQYLQQILSAAQECNNDVFTVISKTEPTQQTVCMVGELRFTLMPVRTHYDRFVNLDAELVTV